MRIGLDGFNLAIPDGTGVATYGASLAKVLMTSGHSVEGVFGIDPGSESGTYESLFFERFGQGDKRALSRKRITKAFIRSPWSGPQLTQVPLTNHVDRRSFGARWPDFSALWSSPLLFELARSRFLTFGRITQVSVPNPPPIMHWTYPVPVSMVGSRNIYTLHDLVPLKLPHTTRDNKVYYRKLIKAILQQADHIATVSEASRNDILSMFDVNPSLVTNTYQSSPIPSEVANSSEALDHGVIQSLA